MTGGALRVHSSVVSFLNRTASTRVAELSRPMPAPAVLREVEALCAQVRRRFLGDELRSYGVLHRTLAEVG